MEKSKAILEFIKHVRAMAKTGLSYSDNPYDIERYEEMREMTATLLEQLGDMPLEDIKFQFSKLDEYPTPKVDVRGVVINDGKILLIRERSDQCWAMPGGWSDIGHTPAENVEKEVWEESGLLVKASRLLAVWDKREHEHPDDIHYVYKLVFLCEVTGGELFAGHETLGADFFDPNNLPPLSLPRNNEAQIRRIMELISANETEFD